MTLLILSWAAAVSVVVGLITRPWKSPTARAPLPMGLAIAMTAWVLITGAQSYNTSIEQQASTAATITIPFVAFKAIIYALLAYALGRTLLTATVAATPAPLAQRWALPAVLAVISVAFIASDVIAIREAALEQHARSTQLSPEAVTALAERVRSGKAGPSEAGQFLRNTLCPPDLLEEFAAKPEPLWRKAVASNDKVSAALAEKLAADPDEEVRYYLAFNRTLPAPILSRLAADPSEMVRDTVAWTKGLPDEDFNRLVNDPSPKVRATVAIQPRLLGEARTRLLADPEQRVREAAERWKGE